MLICVCVYSLSCTSLFEMCVISDKSNDRLTIGLAVVGLVPYRICLPMIPPQAVVVWLDLYTIEHVYQ